MICSKCNSEIPSGAKFCSVCGAYCEPAAAKTFCRQCGNELNVGAKFCVKCGSSTENLAVNLAKPASDPAPEAFTGGSTGNNVPYPAPSVPSFAPSANAGGYYPDGNFGQVNGTAAVVAAPAVKKKNGKKIALAVGIVLAVLVAAAAVLFFTNKAFVMSLVMGKPKYAAMIEKTYVTKFTDSIDTDALSKQIKTFSQAMSANAFDDDLFLSHKSDDYKFMMMSGPESLFSDGIDVKSVIKSANEYMQSIYGSNRMSGSVKISGDLDIDDDDIQEFFDAINGSEFTYDFAATETMIGGEFGFTYNGKPVNFKVILDDTGALYIALPFVSDTAFKANLEAIDPELGGGSSETVMSAAVLELDSGELKRLINELVDVYAKYIEKSSVTMDSGSLTVAGKVIEGKKLTADINGSNLENLIKEMVEHFANDDYVCGKVVEYVNSYDPGFTDADYKNLITGVVSKIQGISSSEKFVITTIINNNGDTLAKSYAFVTSGLTIPEIALAEDGSESVFEVRALGQKIISFNHTKSSEKDGSGVLSIFTNIGNNISVLFDYSGADTVDFGKSKVSVGSFHISLDTSNAGSYLDDMEYLNGLSASAVASVENGAYKISLDLFVNGMMDINFTSDMTLSNDVSSYTIPSDVIDVTSAFRGEGMDEDTEQRISDYGDALMAKIKDSIPIDVIEDLLGEALEG